jgi:hypothetical protein
VRLTSRKATFFPLKKWRRFRKMDRGEPTMGLRTFAIATTVALFAIPGLATAQNPSSEKDKIPLSLDYYRVQCGILSREGLPKGTNSRLTRAGDCQLTITVSDADVTTLNFTGKIDNQKITWSFEGDAKSNVFKQLAPQAGGKFIRGEVNRGGLACFVPFDLQGLDDTESIVCYRRATLQRIYGKNFPMP